MSGLPQESHVDDNGSSDIFAATSDEPDDDKACNMWLDANETTQSCMSMPDTSSNFLKTFGFLNSGTKPSQVPVESVQIKNTSATSRLPSGNAIIVNTCQKGNPVLEMVSNVPWKYQDPSTVIHADYILGPSTCCLFLSLRYHALKPEYIYNRLKNLRASGAYSLRILLCLVDVKDPSFAVRELVKACVISSVTLVLAFSNLEAATYLETFKAYENKPADTLKSRPSAAHAARAAEVLSSVRSLNTTDAHTLLTTFESISGISDTSEEQLGLCPGIGGVKARSLHKLFNQPFLKAADEKLNK